MVSMITQQAVTDFLKAGGYIADDAIATAVYLAIRMEKPILIEGPPGLARLVWQRLFPPRWIFH